MPGRVGIVPDDRAIFFRTEAPDKLIVFVKYLERFLYWGPGCPMIRKEIGMIQYGRASESNGSKDLLLKLILKMGDARKRVIGAHVRPNCKSVSNCKANSFCTLDQTSAALI